MLGKFMMWLGAASFAMGFWEAQSAFPGSHKEIEAGLLMIIGFPVGCIGIWVWRKSIKKCPACAERIKKEAIVCKHCNSPAQ